MLWIISVVLATGVGAAVLKRRRRGTGRGGPWRDPSTDAVIARHQQYQNPWGDIGPGGPPGL